MQSSTQAYQSGSAAQLQERAAQGGITAANECNRPREPPAYIANAAGNVGGYGATDPMNAQSQDVSAQSLAPPDSAKGVVSGLAAGEGDSLASNTALPASRLAAGAAMPSTAAHGASGIGAGTSDDALRSQAAPFASRRAGGTGDSTEQNAAPRFGSAAHQATPGAAPSTAAYGASGLAAGAEASAAPLSASGIAAGAGKGAAASTAAPFGSGAQRAAAAAPSAAATQNLHGANESAAADSASAAQKARKISYEG